MASRDLYQVLGVARTASQDDIKQAYRRLARESHPDVRRDDPHATDRFKEINEAYSVLSDPEKRAHYDAYGEVGGARGPFAGTGSPFEDIFDMFFGGRASQRRDPNAPEAGDDLRYDLEVTLEEVATGVERAVKVTRHETCATCFGTGAEAGSRPETCPTCKGTGEVHFAQRTLFGVMTQVSPCAKCGGTGTYIAKPCKTCRGAGRVPAAREVTISVPIGIEDGRALKLTGEGEAGSRGGANGDLYVVIRVKPHKTFLRRGRDLVAELPISMVQAALGDEIQFPGLLGEETVEVPAGTQPGDTITARGRGLKDMRGTRGDLYLTVRVTIPKRLTAEQRTLLEAFDGRQSGKGRGRKPLIGKVKDLLQ
jgi:molecular chaperone DnaJ